MRLKLGAMKRARTRPAAAGRYRVVLHGFSEFERTALAFCLKHAAARKPAYVHVERAADADFIVADASHEALATSVTRGARLRDTLFVGEHAPPGARPHVGRPIDPEQILRALDDMVAERAAPASAEPPDIVLPIVPRDSDFPTLSEFDIVETAPAAFERAPVLINLADLAPIVRPRAGGTPPGPEGATPPAAEAAPRPPSAPQDGVAAAIARAPHATSPAPAQGTPRAPAPAAAPPPAAAVPAPSAPAAQPGAAGDAAPEATAASAPAKAGGTPGEAPAAAGKHALTPAERAEAKAAARRRSRRARLAQAGRAGAESLCDVVLLAREQSDADLGARLEAFGFRVHPAAHSADALSLIAALPLAAVFLDVAPGSDEDMDGLELCMEIKQRRAVLAGTVPPVFLLANRDSAAGRVRAELAGCDALLIRPVTRGDVARALEASDVVLPADERRIERP